MKRRFVSTLTVVALCLAAQAHAEGTGSDFTFRRIAAPQSGSSVRRITVQIDPEEQRRFIAARNAAAAAAREAGQSDDAANNTVEGTDTPTAPRTDALAWFWAGVSPTLGNTTPARLEQAVAFLNRAPAGETVYAPRLQTMQNMAETYGTEILQATVGKNVSPALVLALISVESSGRTDAVSSAGAAGLMQLMPATAERFGVVDRTVAADNIKGGVAYLDWLMNEFDGDPIMVLAGYNAGENAVKSNGGVPPYAETRAYVPKVLAAWAVARGLCLTPPELMSDGCVFTSRRAAADG